MGMIHRARASRRRKGNAQSKGRHSKFPIHSASHPQKIPGDGVLKDTSSESTLPGEVIVPQLAQGPRGSESRTTRSKRAIFEPRGGRCGDSISYSQSTCPPLVATQRGEPFREWKMTGSLASTKETAGSCFSTGVPGLARPSKCRAASTASSPHATPAETQRTLVRDYLEPMQHWDGALRLLFGLHLVTRQHRNTSRGQVCRPRRARALVGDAEEDLPSHRLPCHTQTPDGARSSRTTTR